MIAIGNDRKRQMLASGNPDYTVSVAVCAMANKRKSTYVDYV